jgi:hypothetical protein
MNDMAVVNQLFIADAWGCVTVQSVPHKTDLNVGNVVTKFQFLRIISGAFVYRLYKLAPPV